MGLPVRWPVGPVRPVAPAAGGRSAGHGRCSSRPGATNTIQNEVKIGQANRSVLQHILPKVTRPMAEVQRCTHPQPGRQTCGFSPDLSEEQVKDQTLPASFSYTDWIHAEDHLEPPAPSRPTNQDILVLTLSHLIVIMTCQPPLFNHPTYASQTGRVVLHAGEMCLTRSHPSGHGTQPKPTGETEGG